MFVNLDLKFYSKLFMSMIYWTQFYLSIWIILFNYLISHRGMTLSILVALYSIFKSETTDEREEVSITPINHMKVKLCGTLLSQGDRAFTVIFPPNTCTSQKLSLYPHLTTHSIFCWIHFNKPKIGKVTTIIFSERNIILT